MNAKERIKNSLAYKLGSQMLSFNQSKFKPLKALILPFKLYLIQRRHYKELAFYKKAIKVFPQLKRRPLESLKDYDEAVFLKKHLSFLLGAALIRANKEAFKGGYFKLFSYIKEAKKEFKYFKDIKDALLELRASLSLSLSLSQNSLDFIVKNSKHLKILFALIESKKVVLSNELLDFIIMHPKEVLTWLNSNEFKEKYLDTNHPYPPLLNPALLNGEDFFENDGLANSKGKGDTGRADGLANSKGEGKSLANLGNKNETLSGGKAEALENSSKQGEACFEGEVSKDEALSGGKAEAVVNSKGEGEGFAKAETQPSKENGALATNTTQSNKEVSNLAHKQNEALSNSSKQDEAVGDNKAEALTNSNSKNEQALTKNSSTNSLKTQASSKDEIQAALKTQALSKSEPQILSNDKSKYKNPDLSYEKIPASLAWQLNLPLPPYYHINFFNNGATASMSILNFFKLCGLRICGYWHYEDAKYKQDYEILIKNKKSFNVIATYINSGTKYFHLLTKKVPLLFVTRDPISKIKSACNHFSSAKISPLMKKFTLANKDFKALFPENIYWGNAAPNINVGFGSHTLQAKLYFDSFLKRVPRFDRFYIFSFDDFSVNKAYETFKKMAKLFKLNMPYDERLYNRRVETKRFGMAVLPTCLYAHKKDLGKDDNALIEGINIHINCDPSLRMKADFFELTEQLLGSKCYINDSEIIIYASKDEARLLLQDKELLEAVKKHLQGYIEALRSNVNETLKSLITEEQVLNFLRKNKEKRKMLKTMCEQELQWFKQNRPEIIASWTYYLEFEKMYKELDEGH